METMPLIDKLQTACNTLSDVQELARGLPEHHRDAAEMVLHIELCKTYLAELALNLARSKEPYDAVLATARGVTKI